MNANQLPKTEINAKPERRKFRAADKQRILRELDQCKPGEIGGILRREGIYSSHVGRWREERSRGELNGLEPQKRGRKGNPVRLELERTQRENARLKRDLAQAHAIIDLQKKVSAMLGLVLPTSDNDETSSSRS